MTHLDAIIIAFSIGSAFGTIITGLLLVDKGNRKR